MLESERTVKRKADHIRICLTRNVKPKITTGFEDIHLVHCAIPETSLSDIDVSTRIFKHNLSAPIIIAAMTGGTREAVKINGSLAEAAEKLGIAMGVGSQRAAIENPKLEQSFKVAREKAPNTFLIANIGCAQLAKGYGFNEIAKAVEMIDANALAVHLNALQEAVQVEGQTEFKKGLEKINSLKQKLNIPIIAKETGSGISGEAARKLMQAGFDAIDVGGAGGISWAAVEYYRFIEKQQTSNHNYGLTFWDWGIPTAASLIETINSVNITTIATGGIRTGIDAAKAIALGAQAIGIALPLLKPAAESSDKVVEKLTQLIKELRMTIFLAGGKKVANLKNTPIIVTGKTAEWLKARGFKLKSNLKEFSCKN